MTEKIDKKQFQSEERPFLDFYKQHNISPVSQDISDIQKHFSRRNALYRSLGMLPSYFEGKELLEFGPGCGHNALYTNSLEPSRYVLVDANPIGLEDTKALLMKHSSGNNNYEVIESSIEGYQSEKLFDVVFCEGVIPYQYHSVKFLKHVASFVKPGGVLIITSQDSVSLLSEILRQFIRLLVIVPEDAIEKKLEILRPIFIPHLNSLKNMSRPVDDWIIDAVLQPIIGDLMSIQQAIEELSQEFEIYGSSPKFLTDWRWYKDIYGDHKKHNEVAIELANKNLHNLLDYRYTHEPQSLEVNNKIKFLCNSVFDLLKQFEADKNIKILANLSDRLKELSETIKAFSFETSVSIENFIEMIQQYQPKEPFPNLEKFAPFFGRGQQYISFTRQI